MKKKSFGRRKREKKLRERRDIRSIVSLKNDPRCPYL